MAISAHEAAAQLAAYAFEQSAYDLYGLAGDVAIGQEVTPEIAIAAALRHTEQRHTPFEAWRAEPDTPVKVEARVILQEQFAAYERKARLITFPGARWIGYSSLRKLSGGSQAHGYRFEVDGEQSVLKQPRGEFNGSWRRRPLTAQDRASFAEQRLRGLPEIPGMRSLEQMKAISYAGSVVTNYLAGKQLWQLGQLELTSITDDNLSQAVRDIVTLSQAGVLLDGNGANTLFKAGEGFKFYDPLNSHSAPRYALYCNLKDFGKKLKEYDEDGLPWWSRTPECEQLRADLFDRLTVAAPQADPLAAEALADTQLGVWKNIK